MLEKRLARLSLFLCEDGGCAGENVFLLFLVSFFKIARLGSILEQKVSEIAHFVLIIAHFN